MAVLFVSIIFYSDVELTLIWIPLDFITNVRGLTILENL